MALSDLEVAFVEASRRDARRATRIRRALGVIAFAVVSAFGVFQYFTLQTRVAQRLAEARATQSYTEQGRTALIDGKHTEALNTGGLVEQQTACDVSSESARR